MSRFYVLPSQIKNSSISISGSDVNHIKNVLRKETGEEISCFDGSGREYTAKIVSFEKDSIELNILSSKTADNELDVKITLVQGLPKLSKMDDIIRKSTELGVHNIVPVLTERSVAKGEKSERWAKIAKEASQQSGRTSIPDISRILSFDDFLMEKKEFDLKLVPWEGEHQKNLKNVLRERPAIRSICILIGPEGGFSHEEIKKASSSGFISVSLGKTILRTETAGPAAIAMVMYELA